MSETTTEFNSSLATLERIDVLLKWCRDAQYMGDLNSFFLHLQNLRKEAMPKMHHEHKKGNCTKECIMCKCEGDYSQLKRLHTLYQNHSDQTILQNKFADKLNEYEIFLRQFMDKKQMLLKDNRSGGLD